MIKLNIIDEAQRSNKINGKQAGLLKKLVKGHTKKLAGATLLAFNSLDKETQALLMPAKKLTEHVAESVGISKNVAEKSSQMMSKIFSKFIVCGILLTSSAIAYNLVNKLTLRNAIADNITNFDIVLRSIFGGFAVARNIIHGCFSILCSCCKSLVGGNFFLVKTAVKCNVTCIKNAVLAMFNVVKENCTQAA